MKPGVRVGHYEILSAIGKGGMGEVWKARDTRLRREVAIKALPAQLAQNSDRLARLEREATLLAAVNHPNIAAIYGLEEFADTRFLVLELVEGRTLADRLCDGPVPIAQALEIALQIAAALEAAHERGVIHRDLKPANIKVTADRRVKVLDFGIAKALERVGEDVSRHETLRTELGAILGTAPYMSPEQARGEVAGRQTDIWSLGVVLFEMLTGLSPFDRVTAAETLAHVLEAHPDFDALPAKTPPIARQLIRRCLEKDPKRRLQHADDVRIQVEDSIAALTANGERGEGAATASRPKWIAEAVALTTLAALGGFVAWSITARPAADLPRQVVRLSIAALDPATYLPYGVQHLAISSDGSRVAFASVRGMLIRRLRDNQTISVDALTALNPFFSPNGEWLGFVDSSDGYKKVPSTGGTPILIAASTERSAGASWGTDGTIVFAAASGLYRVPEDGGEPPRLLARPDPERNERLYAWPQLLPGGCSVLFTIVPEGAIGEAQVAVLDLETLEKKILLTGGTAARYAPTGHLVYAVGEALTAIAYDAASRATRGEPVSIEGATIAASQDNGAADYAVSETGTLLFVPPIPPPGRKNLVWIDRAGNEEPLRLGPQRIAYPRVSPDGSRVAIDIAGENRDIWIWDIDRASLTRLTSGPTEDMLPLWSPDGRRVYFSSDRRGNFDIYSQPADGSTDARVELAAPEFHSPESFTTDGAQLIVFEEFRHLSVLDLERSELTPLLHRNSADRLGQLSPDGNWIAYESDEAGPQFEIFVRPFPNVDARREKVSIDGGRYPEWGMGGSNELYYVDPRGAMMAAEVELSPDLRLGPVAKLFDAEPPPRNVSGRPYDVSPRDGRFILGRPERPSTQGVDVSVVLNWFEELRAQVPSP